MRILAKLAALTLVLATVTACQDGPPGTVVGERAEKSRCDRYGICWWNHYRTIQPDAGGPTVEVSVWDAYVCKNGEHYPDCD